MASIVWVFPEPVWPYAGNRMQVTPEDDTVRVGADVSTSLVAISTASELNAVDALCF